MIFIDSNVIIDASNPASDHAVWARRRLSAVDGGTACINPIIAAEIAAGIDDQAQFEALLKVFALRWLAMDRKVAFRAGRAFREWIEAGGRRGAVLPDLLIGAHAEVAEAAILTRDTRRFHRYFPQLKLITPETNP